MFKPSRLLIGLCLAVGLLLVASAPMFACMSNNGCSICPAGCSCTSTSSSTTCNCSGGIDYVLEGPRTNVLFLDANEVRVTVQGYDTTQLNPLTNCVTAFPPLGTVASVDSVVNYDGRTGEPFEEVTFYRSEVPSATVGSFAQEEGLAANDEPWHTFQSLITGTVEDGIPNYFVIDLTLREGVSRLEFLDELKTHGLFLTSGSDEAGTPNHHPYFRQIGDGPITAGQPFAVTPHGPQFPAPGDGAAELY